MHGPRAQLRSQCPAFLARELQAVDWEWDRARVIQGIGGGEGGRGGGLQHIVVPPGGCHSCNMGVCLHHEAATVRLDRMMVSPAVQYSLSMLQYHCMQHACSLYVGVVAWITAVISTCIYMLHKSMNMCSQNNSVSVWLHLVGGSGLVGTMSEQILQTMSS